MEKGLHLKMLFVSGISKGGWMGLLVCRFQLAAKCPLSSSRTTSPGKAAFMFGYLFLPIVLQVLMMLAAIDMWRHKEARSVRLMLVYLWILLGWRILI